MNILGEHLPAALNHVLLQADLDTMARLSPAQAMDIIRQHAGQHGGMDAAPPLSPTERSTVRRGAKRARTDRADLYAVLGEVDCSGTVLMETAVVRSRSS